MREYEQRFGKNLDEDVKIGVIHVLGNTTPSEEPLPLGLPHFEELRAGQDDAIPSTSGHRPW